MGNDFGQLLSKSADTRYSRTHEYVSRLPPLGPAACATLALVVSYVAGPHLYDDAYITLRYARSIADAHAFVFNPGERVLGTTTPLFTLAIAALHMGSGISFETLAFALAVAGHAAAAALIALFGCRCGFAIAGVLAGVLYAVAPVAVGPTLGGMETSLFTAAALAALMPPTCPLRTWQNIVAAAAVLLRPEGVLVALLRIAAAWRTGRRAAWRTALVIAVCTLPWIVFATTYFGSPLPQSVLAKWAAAGHASAWRASEFFLYLLLSLPFCAPLPSFGLPARVSFGLQIASNLPIPGPLGVRHAIVLIGAALMMTLMAVGGGAIYRRCRDSVWMVAFALLYVVSYSLVDPPIFGWYLVPPLPIALLLFLVAGVEIVQVCIQRPRRREWTFAALAVALLAPAVHQLRRLPGTPLTGREQAYHQAVLLIGPPAQDEHTVIGALEIGTVGYFTRARVLDYYGLVSPDLLGRGIDTIIETYHPDYFIVHEGLARWEGVLSDAQFIRDYERCARVDASAGFVRAEIQVWQRRDAVTR